MTTNILLYILIALALVNCLLIFLGKRNGKTDFLLERLEKTLRDEMSISRKENSENAAKARQEQAEKLIEFENSMLKKNESMSNQMTKQLGEITKGNNEAIINLSKTMETRIDAMKDAVDKKLFEIQKDNGEKIEQMRKTVDEKLHESLEKRLSESFKSVSERLEQVHKGLGEMQTLAEGVGGLKKVLSGVKTRGILGEIQLGAILEQLLNPGQYDLNVATKPQSRDVVEFAIKMPGHDEDSVSYLPIDSKFPLEPYERLLTAYDMGDCAAIDTAAKELEAAIKKSAKDISDKYIYPPNTLDFGILFLPIEGLYAEVLRRDGLVENIMRNNKIVIAGPTTLAALLNSLQMGFKTLAIEKRSSEVWNILAAVKTEFLKFGDVLETTQKRIQSAGDELDKLVGTRTRKIMSHLRGIENDSAAALPENEE